MDLFSVVRLLKSTQVTIGARPTIKGKPPLLVDTADNSMEAVKVEQEETPPVIVETQFNQGFPKSITEVSQIVSLESVGVSKSEGEGEGLSRNFKTQSH